MLNIKFIGILLLVLLGLFMFQGMIFGAMFFFYVLRLAIIATIIGGAFYFLNKIKK